MEQIFIAMAKLMPEDTMLDELAKAVENHKVLRTAKTESDLMMWAMLFTGRISTKKMDLIEAIDKFKEHESQRNLFKNKEQ